MPQLWAQIVDKIDALKEVVNKVYISVFDFIFYGSSRRADRKIYGAHDLRAHYRERF